jgi:hypothetical protein
MHGYNNIDAAAPVGRLTMLPAPERDSAAHRIAQLLVARDYQETITYSFVDKQWEVDFCANVDPVMLANPIAAQMNADALEHARQPCRLPASEPKPATVALSGYSRSAGVSGTQMAVRIWNGASSVAWRMECGARAMGFTETHCRLL